MPLYWRIKNQSQAIKVYIIFVPCIVIKNYSPAWISKVSIYQSRIYLTFYRTWIAKHFYIGSGRTSRMICNTRLLLPYQIRLIANQTRIDFFSSLVFYKSKIHTYDLIRLYKNSGVRNWPKIILDKKKKFGTDTKIINIQ